MNSPFLTVPEVAALLRCSPRSVHELTRQNLIPHRKLPGARRCLFRLDELQAWANGAALEVLQLHGGGRVVRPTERYSHRTPALEATANRPKRLHEGDC